MTNITIDTTAELDPRDAVLGTVNLTRRFGGVTAVDEVNLVVEPGELHAIIGPNGAGKTTLFNLITHVLAPSEGSVWLEGRDITDFQQERRPHLGLARSFQSNQLFNDLTVIENVRVVAQTTRTGTFRLDLFRDGEQLCEDSALSILERVNIDNIREEKARNLSHGDQRRLGIAMALATEPNVLLLDEPTSGMGPNETQATADLIASLQSELDLTVLLIEHDMSIVLSMSDRISVLNQGAIIATGSPAEIRGNEDVQNAYLGGMKEEL
ncbi:ABC transporter ATP-binding protein [Haladaptatus pallidirubidus]|uniref:Probable branched-chain amino acid transport ATP-binding protein LivG n=1 Tax=Haladaptatus pallidirubidus TaxID=1008152 RepID=A0AAV3UNL9_9EURY|nr:ABC transporter ATP-binding protein [Haladaptatus pallidirubidus]